MITTAFSDEIISSSELRNNQKKWLECAVTKPVTVNFNRQQLVIMNREHVSSLYTSRHYLELVITLFEEMKKNRKSRILAWVNDLTEENRIKFQAELLNTALQAASSDSWQEFEEFLDKWRKR